MISDDAIRKSVADALNVEPSLLRSETALNALPDFDSVQLLTLMVVLDEIGVIYQPSQIAELRTFGDVLALKRS